MIAALRKAAQIDLTGPRSRLDENERDRREIDAAIVRAERERAETVRTLNERRSGEVDAAAIADAFLAGEDGGVALESIDALQVREQSLRAAIGELRRRMGDLDRARAEIRRDVAAALAVTLAPVATALADRAEVAVRELVAVLHDAQALHGATSGHSALDVTAKIERPAEMLCFAFDLADPRTGRPSGDLAAALAPHLEAIRLAGGRAP